MLTCLNRSDIGASSILGLKYYSKIDDAPLSDLFRNSRVNTNNQFMVFSDSIWQDYLDTGRSMGAYILFYRGGPIYHCTHVPGPVDHYSTESEYNAECTTGMNLENFRNLNNEFSNKNLDAVPEQAPQIILSKKSAICMAKNGKDTKRTR